MEFLHKLSANINKEKSPLNYRLEKQIILLKRKQNGRDFPKKIFYSNINKIDLIIRKKEKSCQLKQI